MSSLGQAARELSQLTALITSPGSLEDVLQRALEALRDVIDYDLAAIFRLDEGRQLRLIAASGPLDGPGVREHTLQLERFPTIRRALATRRPIPMEAHHHAGEGDPYDGVLDLPDGHSCMIVPLFTAERDLGVITLDRQSCGVYPASAVALAAVYGQLVSLALLFAQQTALLDRYRHRLHERNRRLVRESGGADVAIARLEASTSKPMRRIVQIARQAAASDLPLLVVGETGTGKEVLCQAVHAWSPRADGPFVRLNCAAIPENLVESELFGHVRGAFSGAHADRKGHFASADGGTLLLDEIGEMPLAAQAKLLRVLQEGVFYPVGSDRAVTVDVRVLAATHRDLASAVDSGRFREDLYYRLAVFPLHVPPLRERTEDIGPLSRTFLSELAHRTGRGPWTLSDAATDRLRGWPWKGNVRELVNVLERATILRPHGEIGDDDLMLGPAPSAALPSSATLPTFEENEVRYLRALLERTGGKVSGPGGAAELAGMNASTLRSRLVMHGLK